MRNSKHWSVFQADIPVLFSLISISNLHSSSQLQLIVSVSVKLSSVSAVYIFNCHALHVHTCIISWWHQLLILISQNILTLRISCFNALDTIDLFCFVFSNYYVIGKKMSCLWKYIKSYLKNHLTKHLLVCTHCRAYSILYAVIQYSQVWT